jgi:hypothetical protein
LNVAETAPHLAAIYSHVRLKWSAGDRVKNRHHFEVLKDWVECAVRLTLTAAIMTLSSAAFALMYFATAGQARSETSQLGGQGFDARGLPIMADIFGFVGFSDQVLRRDMLRRHRPSESAKPAGVGAGRRSRVELAGGLDGNMTALAANLPTDLAVENRPCVLPYRHPTFVLTPGHYFPLFQPCSEDFYMCVSPQTNIFK